MDCSKCKGDNRKGARFCRHCGAELAESPMTENDATEAKDAVLEDLLDKIESHTSAEVGAGSEPSAESGPPEKAGEPEGERELEVKPTIEKDDLEVVDKEPDEVGDPAKVEGTAVPDKDMADDGQPVDESGQKDLPDPPEALDQQAQAPGSVANAEDGRLAGEPAAGQEGPFHEDEAERSLDEVDTGAADPLPVELGGLTDEKEVLPPPEWIKEDLEGGAGTLPDLDMGKAGFWRDEKETMSPMAEGMVIADRYMVLDILDAQHESILYYVRDLRRCWQCGHEGNAPDETFCARCGAALDRKPGARLLEVRDADQEPEAGETVTARLEHEGRHFLVLVEPEPRENGKIESRDIRLIVGQASDAGLVRELDEDSVLTLTMAPTYVSKTSPVLGLFAVADGMGGHEGGEVASKIALQAMGEHVLSTIILPEVAGEFTLDEDVVVRLRQATMEANDQVYLARQKRGNDMGTTLTTVLVRNERLFFAHVGDCRAYRWNADGLQQLTTDHSVVASMVATGRAEPEDLYTHPHRSVIYRCIGDRPTVQVDTDALRLAPGDRIIVCCDGLWEMIRDEGIADVMMQEAEPQSACDLLIKRANAAGGEDNISVIVVQVEPV